MPKSTTFRFAISDNEPRSEVWSLFRSGNDVYLTGDAYCHALKISLHASGVCQVALLGGFFDEHLAPRSGGPTHRDILRWKRLPTPDERGQVALSILFASSEPWNGREGKTHPKPHLRLVPPPHTQAVFVDFSYSREDPRPIATEHGWIEDILHVEPLPSGETVVVTKRLERLPDDFFDTALLEPRAGHLFLGVKDHAADVIADLSVLDCVQYLEGHALVYSLHGIRLRRVRKVESDGPFAGTEADDSA